jgi:ribosomal silencing factor RsfS
MFLTTVISKAVIIKEFGQGSSLEHIRAILHKILNKMSEKQGVKKYIEKCPPSNERWIYIKTQVNMALVIKLQEQDYQDNQESYDKDKWLRMKKHCARIKIHRTIPGLYHFSTWDELKMELYRFEVEEDLLIFWSIFNLHSIDGIRNRSPNIEEKSLKLMNNTALNVVI